MKRSLGVFAACLALSGLPPASALAADCDRACLSALLDDTMDALAAGDPGRLTLAPDVRFTENSQELALGEGAWAIVTGQGDFRQDYIDEARQIAASHAVLPEADGQLLYSVLLHVRDAQIAGIETLVQHITPESRFQPEMLDRPLANMNDPVPAQMRRPREEMIRIGLTYTEGLRIGSFVDAPTPFTDDAYRIENGVFMAGAGCPRDECPDILTQRIIEHPDIIANVAAVDEENGVVLLWMNFGDTGSYGEGNALVTFEAFKIWGDAIRVVHAFFPTLPVETRRGWPESDPLP